MKILVLIAIVLTLAGTTNYAQSSEKEGTEIGGRVVDLLGKPLKGVKIRLQFDPTRLFKTETDAAGQYIFQLLTSGAADLTVSEVGFKTYRNHLYLSPGQQTILDIGMQVGFVTDSPRVLVRGVVRNSKSKPIEASFVARSVFNADVVVFSRSSKDGSFELDIPSYGDYFVYATSPGKKSQVRLLTLNVEKTYLVDFVLASLPLEK